VFAASSLDGAAREQYAAMEAGGGAVAAPPSKRGSSTTGQPQAAAAENRSGPFGHDYLFSFFLPFPPPSKGCFSQKRGPRAGLIRGVEEKEVRFSCLCAYQGKRDKYS
jgi:hypothetical protein